MHKRGILIRIILSVLAIIFYGFSNYLFNPVSTVLTGKVAGQQFNNSDVSYAKSMIGMDFFSHIGILFVLLLLVIFLIIWWKPFKQRIKYKITLPAILLFFITSLIITGFNNHTYAYYNQTDRSEVYFILPNESAFYIPDVGANQDSQVKFGSVDYLRRSKIAAKRFQIPHVQLKNSAWLRDYFVPAGRLIIVDRTPYNREWVASADRGTSIKDESFPCQSSEGINMTYEITIAASVHEDDSPKFLYWFGVDPPKGDRNDPDVTFASVYHAKSLAEIMDSVVRSKVQAVLSDEVSKRTFTQANQELPKIMASIREEVGAFIAQRGITLDYLGWAGTVTFDPTIQKAVNDAYIAKTLAPAMPALQGMADIKVKEGLAKGLSEKGLPSFLPPGFVDWITGLIKGK